MSFRILRLQESTVIEPKQGVVRSYPLTRGGNVYGHIHDTYLIYLFIFLIFYRVLGRIKYPSRSA